MKKAEDCSNAVILRFTETAGHAADCRLSLFFTPTGAAYCTNDEQALSPAETDGCTVRFRTDPHAYTTLKVYGDFCITEE
jgi:hypothetical protein